MIHKHRKYIYIFLEREREREREKSGERGRGRERILSTVTMEPDMGLNPTTHWDHDLNQNQESDAQPTEPSRCPHKMLVLTLVLMVKFNIDAKTSFYIRHCIHTRDMA